MATFFFWASPLCLSFFAESYVILRTLRLSQQHQQELNFSFSFLQLSLCPRHTDLTFFSVYLKFFWLIWQELSSLSFCTIRLQWFPGIDFFWAMTRLMISLGVVRFSCFWLPVVVFIVLCFIIVIIVLCFWLSIIVSPLSILLFFWTGGLRSHLNYSTQRAPRSSLRNLCSLVTFTVSSLLFAAANTLFCYTLIFLELAESRILPVLSAVMRHRTSLVSFCTVQLWNFCAARSLAIPWFSTTSGLGPIKLSASGALWSSAKASSLERGRATTK